jgi:hypothetical protein
MTLRLRLRDRWCVAVFWSLALTSQVSIARPCADPATPVLIEDERLRGAVAAELGRTDVISCGDLASLTKLIAKGKDIASLVGLEHAVNLQRLVLRRNGIEELTPISALRQLERVDLGDNAIRDMSALAGLPRLKAVALDKNRIEDLSPLLGNVHVGAGVELDLSHNCLDLTDGSAAMQAVAALRARGADLRYRPQRDCAAGSP